MDKSNLLRRATKIEKILIGRLADLRNGIENVNDTEELSHLSLQDEIEQLEEAFLINTKIEEE